MELSDFRLPQTEEIFREQKRKLLFDPPKVLAVDSLEPLTIQEIVNNMKLLTLANLFDEPREYYLQPNIRMSLGSRQLDKEDLIYILDFIEKNKNEITKEYDEECERIILARKPHIFTDPQQFYVWNYIRNEDYKNLELEIQRGYSAQKVLESISKVFWDSPLSGEEINLKKKRLFLWTLQFLKETLNKIILQSTGDLSFVHPSLGFSPNKSESSAQKYIIVEKSYICIISRSHYMSNGNNQELLLARFKNIPLTNTQAWNTEIEKIKYLIYTKTITSTISFFYLQNGTENNKRNRYSELKQKTE